MTRNLKALGLALVALFAMAAMTASVASAQQGKLTTSNGAAATLKATETGVNANALKAFGKRVECPGTILTAHKYNVTPHVAIPPNETTATLTPHYGHCHTFIPATKTATVTMNGCDFVLHVGLTTGGVAGTYGATADVVCPVGKVIEVHIYDNNIATSVANHVAGKLLCTLKIKGQNGLAGAHVTNTPAGNDFDVHGTFLGIHVEREGLCLLDGLGSTTATGEFELDATVKSTTAGQNVSVTDTP